MEEYSIDPIKLFLEREEKIQTLPYFPPEKKRKRTNHLVNELQKKKNMNSEALFILTALDIWDWNILKFNLKISSPLLKQKHYTLDVLAQKKEKYFFISLFQPGKKHFFSQHNWPLKEIFSDLNEHFLDLLVQKIFLNFPPECPIKYFVLVQNDEGVTRKELPDFILQHESKIFQKLKGDLS